MTRSLLLLFCTCCLTACATGAAGPLRRDWAPSADVARTAAARAALVHGLRTGDWAAVERLIAPAARLRLPDGHVSEGRGVVLTALRGVTPERPAIRADFELARTRSCTGALQDVGMLIVTAEPGGGAALARWHATLLWRPSSADGALQLHDAALYPSEDFSAYRRACRPVPDSTFEARRFTAFIEAGAAGANGWGHADVLEQQLRRTGWHLPLSPDLPGYLLRADSAHEVERPALAGLGARMRLRGSLFAAFYGNGFRGNLERGYPDQASRVQLEYRGLEASTLAGVRYRWLHAAAGPAFLLVSGDWSTTQVFDGSTSPPGESWTAWSLGLAGQAGVLMPFTSRLGLDISGRYRHYPALDIAGYRGSAPMRVEFGHWGGAASLAVKF